MKLFLLILEFISAATLIILVLMHSPKGEGLGGIGGQARVFGHQKGMESGLDKATWIFAGAFIIIAIILGVFF